MFYCIECGDVYNSISSLCDEDFDIVSGLSPDELDEVLREFELTCYHCDAGQDELDVGGFGRTDVEVFENSGLRVDEGRRQFLRNNY